MIDFGLQTQQGYLRVRHIRAVDTVLDGNNVYLNVYAGEKCWRFSPEPTSMVESWLVHLRQAMATYHNALDREFVKDATDVAIVNESRDWNGSHYNDDNNDSDLDNTIAVTNGKDKDDDGVDGSGDSGDNGNDEDIKTDAVKENENREKL